MIKINIIKILIFIILIYYEFSVNNVESIEFRSDEFSVNNVESIEFRSDEFSVSKNS
jgi:hypothetical protein